MSTNLDNIVSEISVQRDRVILEQLGELTRRGLLVVEQTEPVLVYEHDDCGGHAYRVKQAVSLKLKDQEYIEKLEADLKAAILANNEMTRIIRERWNNETTDKS